MCEGKNTQNSHTCFFSNFILLAFCYVPPRLLFKPLINRRCGWRHLQTDPLDVSVESKYHLIEIELFLILLVDPLKASEMEQSLGASPAEQSVCILGSSS